MLKKYRFLAVCVSLCVSLSCLTPAVFAEETEENAVVSVAAADYTGWKKGHANASEDGAITPNVSFEGKDALCIDNRNAYYVLDEAVSSGKLTFSFNAYIETEDRSFRVYFENAEAEITNTDDIFAEVINNDLGSKNPCSSVFFGPNTGVKTNADKLFDFSSSDWYHFDIILDYDNAETDEFITIKASDKSGKALAEKSIGSIAGKNNALKQIRLVQTTPKSTKMYFSDMSIKIRGNMVKAKTIEFSNDAEGEVPNNWLVNLDPSTASTVKVVKDGNKKVLELKKDYDNDSADATKAVFAQFNFGKEYSGITRVEADVKLTVPGRIGMYLRSEPPGSIKTSTIAPRFMAWSSNSTPLENNVFQNYQAYVQGQDRPKYTVVPPTDQWQTWVMEIDGNTGKYSVYIDTAEAFSDLEAASDYYTGTVGAVGFQIQSQSKTLGTIRISEVRVFNDSIVDPSKEIAKIERALEGIELPETTEGEALTLPEKVGDYSVTWSSSNPEIISPVGVVTRPATAIGDIEVTLTATVYYEGTPITREFTVTSLDKRDPDELIKAQILADLMDVGLTEGEEVSADITLPVKGTVNGSAISWITSNASLISANGKVKRPAVDGTRTVKLTAVGELNGIKMTYAYNIKVKGKGKSTGSSGSGGGGGGAYVPIKTPAATKAPDSDISAPDSESKAGFTDVANVAWASEAIDYMFANGYVEGVGNGMFAPNDAVTREQFVKMLVNVFELTAVENATVSFSDVNDGAWYTDFVKTAASRGIVSGMGDGRFGVGEPISRQDMAVMIWRCLQSAGTVEPSEAHGGFSDNSEIAAYATDSVRALLEIGYLSGDENGNFNPKKTATRAETAAVLYRIVKK